MRKIEQTVYQYSDLSDKAKEKAYYKWLSPSSDYPWHNENSKTIDEFAKALGLGHLHEDSTEHLIRELKNLDILTKEGLRGKGKKFVKSLEEKDCPFTGYWLDYVIVDTLKEHCMVHPFDLKTAVIDALQEAEKAVEKDIYDYYSQESFADICEANDYEFFADGARYYAE